MFEIFFYIVKYIIRNLALSCISIFFGFWLCFWFFPIYFEECYYYFTYFIIFILIIFLLKKKKFIYIVYLINFLVFTAITSYLFYKPNFLTKKEQKEIYNTIKKQCENEPKDTKNINCIYYRLNENNKKNK